MPLGPLVGALRRPIGIGDEVATNDSEGVVKDITLRAIELTTLDGQTVFIPNSTVWRTRHVRLEPR